MQNYRSNLGSALKARRKLIRLSQEKLAMLAGCSRLLISEIENGRGNPQLDNLLSILQILGLQITIEQGKNTLALRLND